MKYILILCTGNSCRSQMAEAFARWAFSEEVEVFSAGIEKHGLNPFMLRVMKEAGFGMEGHFSKTVEELPAVEWDAVVTVCGHAAENCPYLPARRHVHLPFDDPPALSRGIADEEEVLAVYRRVRDEIAAAMAKPGVWLPGWDECGSGEALL
ncbi:arsenate reductase ArsC [Akkermansia glycaniphila]|uniref:arsenate reductase ArsC n=1 Tax=Akkermansia glycaniphila TaxID=1679444 RepID=UPI001C00D0CB|nr:arsenate reductase ArsC [Akkermansia glycaniphila]MBT9449356.1 arsenate reductase ArsC [Akkermansia glycaniphila]